MTTEDRAATIGGIALLERAVNYTLGSLLMVTADALPRRTECAAWTVGDLLAHLNDALCALSEAVEPGRIELDPPAADGAALVDPVARLRNRACDLMGAWTAAGDRAAVLLGGCPVTTGVVAGAGAIEVAVHGWDVARACGRPRPIPAGLAEQLWDLAPLFVTATDRPGRFGAPVAVSPLAGPADRLIAFLGRQPD